MTDAVEEVILQHRFVVLPTGLGDTRLALRHHVHNGIAYCDALAFREANGGGQALREEAALLARSLPQLSQQLIRGPHVSSAFRHKVISFLGRKTHILCNSEGHPLRCQLHPLLILPNSSQSYSSDSLPKEIKILTIGQLDQYITEIGDNSSTHLPLTRKWLVPLRRSYKLLGGAVLLAPFLLGLSGLLSSFGSVTTAALTAIAAGIMPLLLVVLAFQSFRTFQQNHIFSPKVVNPHLTPLQSNPSDIPIEPRDASAIQSPETPVPESASWNPSSIAAFLSQSVQSAMTASLSAYRTENWQSFSGFIRSFLLNGLRLCVHKQTGQMPQSEQETLNNLQSLGESRTELESWLHRLSTKEEPMTGEEAKSVGNFVMSLLLRLQAIPPSWEEQFFRIIPRLPSTPSQRTESSEPSQPRPEPSRPEPQSQVQETAEHFQTREEERQYPEYSPLPEDSHPSTPQVDAGPSPDLLVEADDVIEEVTTTSTPNPRRRAVEVDVEAAQQRRELAPLVPVALAVVHLPEDQSLLENMEAALQHEDYLVAQFVDLSRHPSASEELQLSRGSIRLRFDGTERVLKSPKTEHLLANIRQIRALKIAPSLNGDSPPETPEVVTPQPEESSARQRSRSKGSRREKQKTLIVAAG